ncbi:putative global transactivator [Balamuthia mandrillaris]
MIKNSSTRAALAAYNLNATNRWCLTGTPIQNSLDDIYSLLHFIRAENMNDRWWWNLMIVKPIRRNNSRGFSRLQNMLQGVVLRRTKQHTIDGKPILSLPPCHIVKIETPFSPTESQFYNALFENAQSIFNAYLESGNLLKHYIHILELLLRLRQCCVHPLLVLMCTTLDWRKQKGRKQTSSLHDLKREYERTLQQLLAKNNEEDINDNKTEKKRRKPADLAACLLSSTPKRSPLERHKASLLLIRNSDKENVLDEEEEEEEEEATMGEAGNGGVDLCYICYSNFEEDVMETSCGHRFCKECIENWLIEGRGKEGAGGEEMEGEGRCPIRSCGRKLTLKTLKNVSQQQQQIEEERRRNNRIEEAERGATPTTPLKALLLKRNSSFWNANEEERKQRRQEEGEGESEEEFHFLRSTKIAALIQELHRHCSSRREMEDRKDSSVSASLSSSPPEKCLVFSQFTMCLDLIELALQQEGFHYVRLDGSLSKSQRAAAINRFKRNPSTTVFLISLKTGGCGLNLTEATRVYLMDPWWNPSAEQQAIDRAFRLGQQRPVTVTRFIIKGSIEERILEIQEEKRRMAHDAFSGTSSLSTAGNTAADDGGVSPSAARVECSHHEGTTLGVKDLRSLFQK